MSERVIKPRGIIKWHPYAAINDPLSFQDEINAYNNLDVKPNLSDQQIEEINQVLSDAFTNKHEVYISYFKDNIIEAEVGYIKKIDQLDNLIYIANNSYIHHISLEEIIYIEYYQQ